MDFANRPKADDSSVSDIFVLFRFISNLEALKGYLFRIYTSYVSFRIMSLEILIPKDKGDLETAEKLKNYSFEEIEPIIPNLLTCIQDMNWPIAGPVSDYLVSISEHLTDHIIEILRGNDEVWKYWCISVFGLNTEKSIDPKLIKEFDRIAINPTEQEVLDEVHELALEFMKLNNAT